MVVGAMAALGERHPALDCRLHEQEAESALPLLRSGELDAVVAEEYAHAPRALDPAVERHELADDQLLVALAAGHPLARRGGPIGLEELAGERWAAPQASTAYTAMVERACRAAGFEPDVRHRVSDLHSLLELARSGLAVALVPALGGAQEGEGLALRPPAQDDLRRGLFVAVRGASTDRPALSVLIEELTVRARAA